MSTKTEICNLAISHDGISSPIANIETDKSEEADACRTFYDISRDETFRDFSWPFATKFSALGLVESSPNNDWAFSYRYPSEATYLHKILSGIRNDSRQTRVSYELGSDDTSALIFTDMENACIKYTKKISDESLYPPDFVIALSFLLAFYIAPRITAGDQFGLSNRAIQSYANSINKARRTAFAEQQDDEEVESEFIRSREGQIVNGSKQTFNEFIGS